MSKINETMADLNISRNETIELKELSSKEIRQQKSQSQINFSQLGSSGDV